MTVLRFGLNLGDAPPDLSGAQQLDVYLRQVDAAQRVGFQDFFVGHHYAYRSARWFQPFPLLARISAELAPESRIGTGILVVPLLNPVAVAEDAAALATMAPGRVVLGVGAGYRQQEYAAFGIPWADRLTRLETAVSVMRQHWAGETAVVNGVNVPSGCRLDRDLWPRIVMGAKSVTGAKTAARLGAGLLAASKQPVDTVAGLAATHRAAWNEPGGPPPLILMRNLGLGNDRETAAAALTSRTGLRMSTYRSEGLDLGSASRFGESDDLTETALLGTDTDLRQQVDDLDSHLDIDSILLRAQWPGMSGDDVVSWLTDVARAVIDESAHTLQSTTRRI